jgi:hypothetical protein
VTAIVQLAALGMLGVALAVWLAGVPSARRARERPPARPRRTLPADLGAITELVTGGRSSAADVHRRVRPLLRDIAAAKLARRGIGLDRDLQPARELLGEELFELVRADRPAPLTRDAPGMTLAELSAITERLEAM